MRAMLDLALHYGEGPILLKDIAQRQQISERYLEHLALSFKAAGLVNSIQGAHGGFMLAKPPSQIRLLDAIQSSEDTIVLAECVLSPQVCSRASLCVVRDIWLEMRTAIDGILASKSLQDLVERQREKEQPLSAMYYI